MLIPSSYYPPAVGPVIGSIDFERDNGECLTSTTNIADFGTGDFTWEAWVKPEDVSVAFRFIGVSNGTRKNWFGFTSSNINCRLGGTLSSSGSFYPSAGVWYHLALTRSSGDIDIWVDGTSVLSETLSDSITSSCQLVLGTNDSDQAIQSFDGKIALARWSSAAKYTSSFTPATDYGVEGDTLALIGSFDGGSTYEDYSGNFTLVAAATNTPTADAEAPS